MRGGQGRVARWWSSPIGVGLIATGVLLEPPFFVFGGWVTRTLFIVGGGLLTILPWRESGIRMRSLAAAMSCAACMLRAATLFLDPPGISRFEVTRAVVYLTLMTAVASLTVLSFRGPFGRS